MTASLLGKGDVLLAISASGGNRHTARVVEIAHGNGARIITLTTKAKNILEEQADLSLYTVSEKTIFESESLQRETGAASCARLSGGDHGFPKL